jgi:hypothetical protein
MIYLLACLPFDPRFAGSNPAEGDSFFNRDKNPQKTVLLRRSKAVVPCSKILRHVEKHFEVWKRNFERQNSLFSSRVLPAFLLDSYGRNSRDLCWRIWSFPCRYHSTMVFHVHITWWVSNRTVCDTYSQPIEL